MKTMLSDEKTKYKAVDPDSFYSAGHSGKIQCINIQKCLEIEIIIIKYLYYCSVNVLFRIFCVLLRVILGYLGGK